MYHAAKYYSVGGVGWMETSVEEKEEKRPRKIIKKEKEENGGMNRTNASF